MSQALSTDALAQLFSAARTVNAWQARPVESSTLNQLYDLWKWGPTSVNCTPARVVFVRSPEAKAKLLPCLMAGNVEKTKAAPVTAIIGMDLAFYEHLPTLMPHLDAKAWFDGNPAFTESTAMRNSSLQGAYLILAARALGLDCGPMSGFDADQVDAAFFAGTSIKTNFLCNLGYGDPSGNYPRGPRLGFEQVCQVV